MEAGWGMWPPHPACELRPVGFLGQAALRLALRALRAVPRPAARHDLGVDAGVLAHFASDHDRHLLQPFRGLEVLNTGWRLVEFR